MSNIQSTGNRSTEIALRSSLVGAGISGFRMHVKDLPGKPDFAFFSRKVAVFVDGCFWHGCPTCYVRPKSRQSYWDEKLKRNRERDGTVNAELYAAGWSSIRIWEHTMKRPEQARRLVVNLLNEREGETDG